mgnify:CR=1 FL=1
MNAALLALALLSCGARKPPGEGLDSGEGKPDTGASDGGTGATDGGAAETDGGGDTGGGAGENEHSLDHALLFQGQGKSELGRALGSGRLGPDGAVLLLLGAPGAGAGKVELHRWDEGGVQALGSIEGRLSGDSAGSAVLAAELNGDGQEDLLVAARRSALGGEKAGEVAVFLGPIDGQGSFGDADWSWVSETEGAYCGSALARVRAEGEDRIAIGCGLAQGRASRSGVVHLLPTEGSVDRSLEDQAALSVDGVGEGDVIGAALAAGDVDGDGLDELAIGGFGREGSAGSFWLVDGAERGSVAVDEVAIAWMFGGGSFDLLGYAVALADLDGDGLQELFVGAPGSDVAGAETGQVLRFRDPVGEVDASLADGQVLGDSYARLGWALTTLPEDDEGAALMIGAPGEDDSSGAAWRIRGVVEGVHPLSVAVDERWVGAGAVDGMGAALGVAVPFAGQETGLLLGAPDGSRAWLWTGG